MTAAHPPLADRVRAAPDVDALLSAFADAGEQAQVELVQTADLAELQRTVRGLVLADREPARAVERLRAVLEPPLEYLLLA